MTPGLKTVYLKCNYIVNSEENSSLYSKICEKSIEIKEKNFLNIDMMKLCIEEVYQRNYKIYVNNDFTGGPFKFSLYMENPAYIADACKGEGEDGELPVCEIDKEKFSDEYLNLLGDEKFKKNSERWVCISKPGKYLVTMIIKNENVEIYLERYYEIEEGFKTVINCSKKCIAGVIKKYTYSIEGEDT